MTLLGDNMSAVTAILEPGFTLPYRQLRRMERRLSESKECKFTDEEYGARYIEIRSREDNSVDDVIKFHETRRQKRQVFNVASIEMYVTDVQCDQERNYCEVFMQHVIAGACNASGDPVHRFSWRTIHALEYGHDARTLLWPRLSLHRYVPNGP